MNTNEILMIATVVLCLVGIWLCYAYDVKKAKRELKELSNSDTQIIVRRFLED